MRKELIKKIKKAPHEAGVYFFKNWQGEIIYVGRSVNLKERLLNYLFSTDPKVKAILKESKSLVIQKTKTLLEAIIKEADFIKRYQPKYNIREKDNRSFVYIVIPQKPWTYPLIIRGYQLKKYPPEKAEIFGPFFSFTLVKNLLRILRKIFPYSTCQLNVGRPCFHYQIGLCPGKCLGLISESDYQKNIDQLILFLKGKKKKLKEILRKSNFQKWYLLENFDELPLLKKEVGEERDWGRIEAYDISHFAGREVYGAMIVFEKGDFNKKAYRLFKIKTAKPNDDLSALREVLERRLKHPEWPYPSLVLVDGGKNQVKVFEEVFQKLGFNCPVVGLTKVDEGKLFFSSKMPKILKESINLSMEKFKRILYEAHRFVNQARKKFFIRKIAEKRKFNDKKFF